MTVFGWLALGAFGWLLLFQAALALGAPLGRLAWGGQHRILPRKLRLASAVTIPVISVGGLAVGQALGLWPVLPRAALAPILWGFAGLFGLSLAGNLASSSGIERAHGAPLAAILALGCALLAIDL
ncbi:hypothetical protein [Jannaschia seohaensis]|uniref:Uncharacterized protein n=1 Tax=Jannaschia seohaensis TaxID=475081 RepID=A0A2Y9ATG8_9RHOB|nr:hypothetical protein [Jannaschia seohaensis]PWJ19135.1 hypothetical protein BCF38_10466 [Jannaschia seohaensis]SSA45787.1 hypothetical protein SAMN05421539_10466 [Jannaschia seohaensis]